VNEDSQAPYSIRHVTLIETSRNLTLDELIYALQHPEVISNTVALHDVLKMVAERLQICQGCGYCYNVRKQQEDDAAAKEFEPGRFEGKIGPDGKVHYERCLNCGASMSGAAHVWVSMGACEIYPYELEVNDRGQPTGYYIDYQGNRIPPLELKDGHE
jgi:ferredoxin